MLALKDAINRGTKFRLTQDPSNAHSVLLEITGGISAVSISLGFNYGTNTGFKWASTAYTTALLVSAVEGMPDEADPTFMVNTDEWNGGGLLLSGVWKTKGRGRSKEATEHYRMFLVDAGVVAVK